MLRSTLLLSALLFGFVAQADEKVSPSEELELRALHTLSGSERKANRMYRKIERYRSYRARADAERAKGIAEEDIRVGGIRGLLGMANLSKTLPVRDRKVLWQITHRELDLAQYIESGGEIAQSIYDPYMEEMVVVGSIFDHMPMDPAEFSVDDIKTMRGQRRVANEAYREGDYDTAYPILLDLAQRGFKDSQSRLAYILFTGTETVNKSNLRALGWLGSAAYGDSEPMFRVLFNKYMDEVPEYVKPTVDKVVNSYQQSFAHDEHQNCSTDHYYTDGSRIKKTYCRFKLESIAEACEFGSFGGKCWAHAVNMDTD